MSESLIIYSACIILVAWIGGSIPLFFRRRLFIEIVQKIIKEGILWILN